MKLSPQNSRISTVWVLTVDFQRRRGDSSAQSLTQLDTDTVNREPELLAKLWERSSTSNEGLACSDRGL